MKFREFLESVIDTKRDPRTTAWEDDDATDNQSIFRSKLGLTAQYPLAKASGNMAGFQVRPPEEEFAGPKGNVVRDKLSGRERIDTLRSKLYADEPMTDQEKEILARHFRKILTRK